MDCRAGSRLCVAPGRRAVLLAALCALYGGVAASVRAQEWRVPEATVRFKVRLTSNPTHRQAGYFVHLPDGGILPGARPKTHVVAGGAPAPSYVLWHSPGAGVGVVFAAPGGAGDVEIYVSPAAALAVWTPDSGLTPSAILCTNPGAGAKSAALALAELGAVPWEVHYRNRPGTGRAPLSLPGDLSGRGGPCSLYMLAHVAAPRAGTTWIAPIVFAGQTLVKVNGRTMQPGKRNNKAGGTGQAFELAQGLHRVELFGWSDVSAPNQGLMTLTWRPPGTPASELGGTRPDDLPYPGTPMWEARPLKQSEIVRSGGGEVVAVDARDGTPQAVVRMTPVENFWLDGDAPLLVYRMRALTAGHPEGTTYAWDFGNPATPRGAEVMWLFPGLRNHRVQLTVAADNRTSSASVPFFAFTTVKTDLNKADCRAHFREAVRDMFTSWPENLDPTANWEDTHWNNLFRTLEMNEGRRLLAHIFTHRWESIEPKLSPERREKMLAIFLDFLPRVDPDAALQWTERLERQARDRQEAAMMQIRRAEIALYYKGAPEAARNILAPILRRRSEDEPSEWARIRFGDTAFLAGDLDEATLLYGDVQDRARVQLGDMTKPPPARAARSANPADRLSTRGLARSRAELDARRREARAEADSGRTGGFALGAPDTVEEWKKNAIVDAAASETIRNLIEQGYLYQGLQALRNWERHFPLSKVSSDFILREAQYYMAVEDWVRAAAILEAYVEQVDASSFIPDAVDALLKCKIRLNEPKESLDAFIAEMKKKLEFHPIGQSLDSLRYRYEAGRN